MDAEYQQNTSSTLQPTIRTVAGPNRCTSLGIILVFCIRQLFLPCLAFLPVYTTPTRSQCGQSSSLRQTGKDDNPSTAIDPITKKSWYIVEAFGNVFGKGDKSNNKDDAITLDKPPQSVQETLRRIQDDYGRSYFLSGEVDALIYDEQCVFSDPFVSFEGRDRFITNLANLGSFVTKFSVRPIEFNADDPLNVKTKVMVKMELGLPWKPVLAWPWGVEYKIDKDSFLITEHKETWDIAPIQGVKQIFRKPTTMVV